MSTKRYALRWIGKGHETAPAHYLYKSVSKDTRRGLGTDALRWQITPNAEQARLWATEVGAAGYALRLHGQFTVERVA